MLFNDKMSACGGSALGGKKNNIKLKIIIWGLVFFLASFGMVQSSTLYIIPQFQNIQSGNSFLADVSIDTGGEEINAIEGVIIFPDNKLDVIDVIKGDSIVSLWINEPNYSSKKGEISFSGGVPKGFKGQGFIFKINFRVKENIEDKDSVEVYFKDNLRVLLNDGKATLARNEVLSGIYNIINRMADGLRITSMSHPNNNKWYSNNVLNLHWDMKEGAEYSYILSRDALIEADEVPDIPEGKLQWMGDIKYEGLEDGIYYFHAKEKIVGGNWSNDAVFRAMIDTSPPEKLTAEIAEIEGKRYAIFTATDKVSGIDHYEITETDTQGFLRTIVPKDEWKIAVNPYLLQDQILEKNIKIKAIDRAGNEQIIEIKKAGKVNFYKVALIILILCLIPAIIFLCVIKKKQKSKNDKL